MGFRLTRNPFSTMIISQTDPVYMLRYDIFYMVIKMQCAIVLAAGKGSRMKSSLPKVFQSIAGLPVLGHIIQTLQQCSFKQKIVALSKGTTLDVLPENLRNVDIVYQNIL